MPQGQPLQMTGKEHRWTGNGRGNFDQIATRNPDCCATTLSMTALDAVCRREAAHMNRAPGSEKKSETAPAAGSQLGYAGPEAPGIR